MDRQVLANSVDPYQAAREVLEAVLRPGRVFRDTGIRYIYLKGYGILLKILNGMLGVYGYKGSWILGILVENAI